MKRGWKILLALAVLLILAIAVPVYRHYRVKRALDTYRASLREQGEKLDIAELIPPLAPAESNGAAEFTTAAGQLSWSAPAGFLSSMPVAGPAHVVPVWSEPILPTQNSSNIWPALSALVQTNQKALAAVRAALAAPVLQFDPDYYQGLDTRLPHLRLVQSTPIRLLEAVVTDLHEGRTNSAWENLITLVTEAAVYHGEPVQVSQMVRVNVVRTALGATWQTLQYPGWTEPQWAGLQRLWDSFNLLDHLESTEAMDRACSPATYDQVRSSYTNFTMMSGGSANNTLLDGVGEAMANPKNALQAITGGLSRRPRYWLWKWWWSYEDELCNLQIHQAGLDAARSLMAGDALFPVLHRFDQTVADLKSAHPGADSRFIVGGLRDTTYLIRNFLLRMAVAETQRRMVVTGIALRRYQLLHGAYPAALKDLTPDFLRETPIDLLDGKPLRYRPAPDGQFVLYSVGEDGQDNGGDATSTEAPGYLHKNWWRARDGVWPAPATPEEARAYEGKLLAEFKDYQVRLHLHTGPPADTNAPPDATTKTNQ